MYDIGRSKRATRAYSLDDIALIPSRRTRGTEMVNLEWRIDALTFDRSEEHTSELQSR